MTSETRTTHRELRAAGRVLSFALRRFAGNALAMFVLVSGLMLLVFHHLSTMNWVTAYGS